MNENFGTSDLDQLDRIIARGEANRLAREAEAAKNASK